MHSKRHAVFVRIQLPRGQFDEVVADEFSELVEDAVRGAVEVEQPRAGYYDGYEFDDDCALLACYGRDALLLCARIIDALLLLHLVPIVYTLPAASTPPNVDGAVVLTVTATSGSIVESSFAN